MSDTAANAKVTWADDTSVAAIADFVADFIGGDEQVSIAVPGGSTPKPILAELGERDLDWSKVEILLTDDRQVPDRHEASNRGALLDALGGCGAKIPPLIRGMAVAPFDLVWLGMGADGHIASLFPTMESEEFEGPAVIATTPNPLPPEAPFDRLSLNMEALTAAKAMMLVIKGAEKKKVLDAALAGRSELPIAQLLAQASCPVTIFWSDA